MTLIPDPGDSTSAHVATYPLSDLCVLADLPIRTVRYYVQNGLVDRPEGETRAARYGARHLEQLLLIKKWAASGVSLERIRELLHGAPPPVPPRTRAVGSVSVCSHLTVSDGIELVIDPGRADLSPEQVRTFLRRVMQVFGEVIGASESDAPAPSPDAAPATAPAVFSAPRPSSRKPEHGPD